MFPLLKITHLLQMSSKSINNFGLFFLDLIHLLILAENSVSRISKLSQAIVGYHIGLFVETLLNLVLNFLGQLILYPFDLIFNVSYSLPRIIIEDLIDHIPDILLEIKVQSPLTFLHFVPELVIVRFQHYFFDLLASHT